MNQQNRTATQIEEVYNALVINVEKAKVPEDVFVGNFLPLFSGTNTREDINIVTWISIAGNPFLPVDVIDDNGEVIYTVPAIFDREVLDINQVDPNVASLAHVVRSYGQLLRNSTAQANQYMSREWSKRNFIHNQKELTDKNIDQWNKIFERYNLPLIITNSPLSGSHVNTSTPDIVYDDDIL